MSAEGFPLSRPRRRSPSVEVGFAAITAVLLPPVGLALAFFWAARGGRGSTPAPVIAIVSLLAAIAMLAAAGGGY
jgi:hypothetical protein